MGVAYSGIIQVLDEKLAKEIAAYFVHGCERKTFDFGQPIYAIKYDDYCLAVDYNDETIMNMLRPSGVWRWCELCLEEDDWGAFNTKQVTCGPNWPYDIDEDYYEIGTVRQTLNF